MSLLVTKMGSMNGTYLGFLLLLIIVAGFVVPYFCSAKSDSALLSGLDSASSTKEQNAHLKPAEEWPPEQTQEMVGGEAPQGIADEPLCHSDSEVEPRETCSFVEKNVSQSPSGAQQSSCAFAQHLCPGLVVPDNVRCTLVVPDLAALQFYAQQQNTTACATQIISDCDGKGLLKVDVIMPRPVSVSGPQCSSVTLSIFSMATELAYCQLDPRMESSQPSMTIFAHGIPGRHAKVIRLDQPINGARYHVHYNPPAERLHLSFRGDILQHPVQVFNEQNQVCVATTESLDQDDHSYQLKIEARSDVGLMLCALKCIEIMERSPT